MKSWSLKAKFGLYSSVLATLSLLAAASVLLPTIYYRQQVELDRQIEEEADELFRDLANFRGAPINPRQPLGAKFLPVSLHDRYIVLKGPEGQLLYGTPELQGAELTGLEGGFATVPFGDKKLRVGAFEQSPYRLQLGADLQPLQDLRATIVRGLAAAAPLAALVVFGGGFLLGKVAVRPISDLTRAAERISVQRLEDRLPEPASRDEIYRLSQVLNDAFDRLKNAYEAATRFSADASHQLKTPLAVLRLGLDEFSERDDLDDSQRETVARLRQQTRRLTTLINDLLLLAQADAGRLQLEPERLDLAALLRAALDDLETLVDGRAVRVEAQVSEPLFVEVDRRRLRMALQVLVENAAKYTPAGGRIQLVASVEAETVVLRVGNSGKSIAVEDRESVFERFRRGAAVGENVRGFGLGLSMARTLLAAHGGSIRIAATKDGWVEFEVRLPIG